MALIRTAAKGLNSLLVDERIDPNIVTIHISEVGPGSRAHAPHAHSGIEGFYILEGQGVVEVGDERYAVGPNEVALIEAETLHGLVNVGQVPLRYMVIIVRTATASA